MASVSVSLSLVTRDSISAGLRLDIPKSFGKVFTFLMRSEAAVFGFALSLSMSNS
jgi:hypothetical protein